MLNATQMSDIVSDARKALKINDYHSAIHRLTVVMDNLIARVPNPDTPPPAPSDDVYLPGGSAWNDGPPPIDGCPYAFRYRRGDKVIIDIGTRWTDVEVRNCVEQRIHPDAVIAHAALPTGGE